MHKTGRGKAAFCKKFGFTEHNWIEMSIALKEHATNNEISNIEQTSFGTRYIIEGPIPTPNGKTPNIRAIWFIETREIFPRFVTAYPLPENIREM